MTNVGEDEADRADSAGDGRKDISEVEVEFIEMPVPASPDGTRAGFSRSAAASLKGGGGGFRARDMYWACLCFFGITFSCSFISGFLAHFSLFFRHYGQEMFLVLSGLFMLLYLRRRIRRKKDVQVESALARRGTAAEWRFGFLVMLVCIPLAMFARTMNDELARFLIRQISPGLEFIYGLNRAAGYRGNFFAFILLAVGVVVFAPINEELWFRGIGMSGYRKTGSVARAVFWTSIVFGLNHGLGGFMHATLLGAALAIIYVHTKSLYIPMGMHAFNNAVAVCLMYMGFV